MGEMRWRESAPDLDDWISEYALRRYGVSNDDIVTAWSLLQNSVYSCTTDQEGPSGSLVGGRPDIDIEIVGCCAITAIYWDPADVCEAWRLLLNQADSLSSLDTYAYDIVQVTTQVTCIISFSYIFQVLSTLMVSFHESLVDGFNSGDSALFEAAATNITELIDGTNVCSALMLNSARYGHACFCNTFLFARLTL